jgi:hypothetical protein
MSQRAHLRAEEFSPGAPRGTTRLVQKHENYHVFSSDCRKVASFFNTCCDDLIKFRFAKVERARLEITHTIRTLGGVNVRKNVKLKRYEDDPRG